MDRLHIYVDGSCLENRNVDSSTRAGWGFCVIEGDSGVGNGKGSLLFEKCGHVETSRESELFIGAEVGSNNTAELSAIGHALRWLLIQGLSGTITIFGDSKYALNVASGVWNPKANRELANKVRDLWNEASRLVSLSAVHVSAHKGHRWNERADHLAFRAMKGDSPLPLQFWKPGLR
ncbi:MAG TPA: RNase H family protein [Candidatus Thalassarchaeaceae archaeon]|nr:RNase H family protein [Candidatus Thalassarchaeaceae archaeon]